MSLQKGYPRQIFENDVENKYLCSYCNLILRNPIQSFCGHRFCKDCLEYLISTDRRETCPSCSSEGADTNDSSLTLEQTFPDNAIKRELYRMRTVCPFQECPWSGSFKDFEVHYTTCDKREVTCTCGITYPLSRQQDHLLNECLLREISCPFCELKVVFKDINVHNEECLRYPVECPNCQEHIPRNQFVEHSRHHEERSKDFCVYRCGQPVSEGSTELHVQQNLVPHLDLLRNCISSVESTIGISSSGSLTNINNSSLHNRIRELEGKVSAVEAMIQAGDTQEQTKKQSSREERQLESTAGSQVKGTAEGTEAAEGRRAEIIQQQGLANKVLSLEEKMNIYEGVISVLNREVEKLTLRTDLIDRQRQQERQQLDAMNQKVKSLERMLALKDVTISELDIRITALEQTSYDGTLLWKVSDFQRRRQDAISGRSTSIYSPEFYTSKTGYKMCSRLYLNGDGMGKGTHVSLFFVIMRGQHDALLKWPFRQKVTLMFLDQNGRENVMDAFRPDPTSSSFKRPTTEMNIASGCPLFMPLSQLESHQHAYVKDNAAFIKIIVNCDDLN